MGHVFHPGHEELHGVTVLVKGNAGQVWVGRYHERTARGVVMRDVAAFDAEGGESVEAWLRKQLKFGVKITHRTLVVPSSDAASIDRLVDVDPSQVR
ncbi:MAG: hypothetical protein R2909_05690 [Gemmatimonadales bacterium]